MVTWICCPVQDSNLETQESFWESFTLYLPFSPNVVRLLKSSWVNEYYVYERLRSFKKYVTLQGGKVTKNDKEEWWGSITSGVTHLNFFISHFFFNSVSPSKQCLVSSSNVAVGKNLWYAGSYWQVFFGNSCS